MRYKIAVAAARGDEKKKERKRRVCDVNGEERGPAGAFSKCRTEPVVDCRSKGTPRGE